MTENEIRERMNRIGNNLAKMIAVSPDFSTDRKASQTIVIADAIAVLTQVAIDIHKIAVNR